MTVIFLMSIEAFVMTQISATNKILLRGKYDNIKGGMRRCCESMMSEELINDLALALRQFFAELLQVFV